MYNIFIDGQGFTYGRVEQQCIWLYLSSFQFNNMVSTKITIIIMITKGFDLAAPNSMHATLF